MYEIYGNIWLILRKKEHNVVIITVSQTLLHLALELPWAFEELDGDNDWHLWRMDYVKLFGNLTREEEGTHV